MKFPTQGVTQCYVVLILLIILHVKTVAPGEKLGSKRVKRMQTKT